MKTLVSVLVAAALLSASTIELLAQSSEPPAGSGTNQPQMLLSCVVTVVAIGVGSVFVYGVWKICKSIPDPNCSDAPDDPPPDVITNLPPTMPGQTNNPATNAPPRRRHNTKMPGTFNGCGPQTTEVQLAGPNLAFNTAYSITINPDGSGTATDPNGLVLASPVPITVLSTNGLTYRIYDFSGVLPAATGPAQFWRLKSDP